MIKVTLAGDDAPGRSRTGRANWRPRRSKASARSCAAGPEQGHGRAMALSGAALVEIEAGELDAAQSVADRGLSGGAGTRDMPIVAMVGVTRRGAGARGADTRRERRDPRRRRATARRRGSDSSRGRPADRLAASAARRRSRSPSCSTAGGRSIETGRRPPRSRGNTRGGDTPSERRGTNTTSRIPIHRNVHSSATRPARRAAGRGPRRRGGSAD